MRIYNEVYNKGGILSNRDIVLIAHRFTSSIYKLCLDYKKEEQNTSAHRRFSWYGNFWYYIKLTDGKFRQILRCYKLTENVRRF